jgi:2,3-bisphosphoglycerate-independent phosphoglycerate mutase
VFVDGAVKSGIKRIRLHPLLDGRDVHPESGLIYIQKLEDKLASLNGVDGKIASGGFFLDISEITYVFLKVVVCIALWIDITVTGLLFVVDGT